MEQLQSIEQLTGEQLAELIDNSWRQLIKAEQAIAIAKSELRRRSEIKKNGKIEG